VETNTLLLFIKEHFSHAAPILAAGAFAMAVSIERAYALYVYFPLKNLDAFMSHISSLVMKSEIGDAIKYCERYHRKPVASVVKAAMSRAHLPESLISDGIQLALQQSSRAILKRTNYLATIANVATLLGLFGTVAGLIQSFEAVGHADAQQKSALLSAGISTAMNATMMGLGVAIPCMILFSFFSNRANGLISDLEDTASKSLDLLKQRYYRSDFIESTANSKAAA
jgi:biopolymer transport protein ExbB